MSNKATIRTTLSILTALLTFIAAPAGAQERPGRPAEGRMAGLTVSGAVVDAATGEPIPSATVAVWRAADSTLATGTVATDNGRFVIEGIRPGRYYVKVSFIGYETATVDDVNLSPQQPRTDLGTIRLAVDTAMLDEVEITAERDFMEVHIDKNVYNTKDQLVSQGGSATDVLRNIPAVEVDMDGQISLRGNQNVAVLINGRPAQMTGQMLASFLGGLPANTIERVEVIPNPSARYEPDGMSGILNIVLKRDADIGLGGSITAGTGTQDRANLSGMLSLGKGPLSARANYGFRYGLRDSEGTRFNEYRFTDAFEYLEVLNTGERSMQSHSLGLNVDYRLGNKNTLSASSMVNLRGGNGDDRNAYAEWAAAVDSTLYARHTEDEDRDLNLDFGLAFRRVIDPTKHELTVDLRYERQHEDEEQNYWQEEILRGADPRITTRERSEMGERVHSTSLQIDYLRPLGREGKLEAGYKGSLQRLETDFFAEFFDDVLGAYVPDVNQNNAFVFDEQIHAAYGIIGQQWGPVGAQVGVRLEQAMTTFELETTGTAYDNDYFSIFPSAFLTYKLSDAHQFRLSYSKRINRPRVSGRFNQLSPFTDLSDPLYRRVGNPYLKPEYTHSMELTYTLTGRQTSLSLSPYFRRTVDVIRSIESVDPNGVTTVTFQNLDESSSWGAEAIGTLRLGSRVNAFASFNAYRVNTDASSLSSALSNDAFGWATRLNATVKVTPTLDVQASWFYRAPMDVEQGRMGAMSWTDVALRQQLFRNKASLSLRVNDPFRMSGFHMERDTPTFYLKNTREWDSPSLGLTLTYNFGQQDRSRNFNRRREQQESGGFEEMEMGY